jgi:hypothetical protein
MYVLRFINTGYFTSNNVPDGIKNATHNTFSNFRKSWLMKLKYPAFFGNGLTQARDYLICTPISCMNKNYLCIIFDVCM